MSDPKYYVCTNKDGCDLGSRGEQGYFTGGMTDSYAYALTGKNPVDQKKGTDYGDGICPNCGQKGKAV